VNSGSTAYVGGALAGFAIISLAVMIMVPTDMDLNTAVMKWVDLNLGSSLWFFLIVVFSYSANLIRLQSLLEQESEFKEVAQLDQMSDVWIHVFVGIGVVWTAVGMRNALATTLDVPQSLTQDAGGVLSRLVDNGILLALTTTIVGAVGGYVMRLIKTLWLGAELSSFYYHHDRQDVDILLQRVANIEQLLIASHSLNMDRRASDKWVENDETSTSLAN